MCMCYIKKDSILKLYAGFGKEEKKKSKVLFRVYQNLSDINHITHRQFNLLIVVIMFHPIIGVRFGFDAVSQTVMVA